MNEIERYNRCGEELERLLMLRTSPVAIKMLKTEADIPEGAVRPMRDYGYHLAQCQAFALSRRKKTTVAMLKEDSWCWTPLPRYGMTELIEEYNTFPMFAETQEAADSLAKAFPCLDYGTYIGIVSAPLGTAGFEPDVVLIYANAAQVRCMLFSVKYKEGALVTSYFDPIGSCVYSIVPVLKTGDYRITVPDPGEYERSAAGDDELIFSVPGDKVESFVSGLKHFDENNQGYRHFAVDMRPDFPQPDFYKKIFQMWGLDAGK